jgi:hypothetical protein
MHASPQMAPCEGHLRSSILRNRCSLNSNITAGYHIRAADLNCSSSSIVQGSGYRPREGTYETEGHDQGEDESSADPHPEHDRVPERPAKPGKVLTFPKRTKELEARMAHRRGIRAAGGSGS